MVSKSRLLAAAAIACCLSACGGGSGGIASIPTPTPTPTPAPSSTVSAPVANTDFSTVAVDANANYDLSSGKATGGNGASATVQVRYDAGTQSYTLTDIRGTQTFAPSQLVGPLFPGELRFRDPRTNGGNYLTLVRTPYSGGTANTYVGLGYWESIAVSGGIQHSDLSFFTYGFRSPDSAVPRQGAAAYRMDVFGLMTAPGREPHVLSGGGSMNIDFLSGGFSGHALLGENSLTSSDWASGWLPFDLGGTLLSTGNGFSGTISYSNTIDAVSGTISGLFYGPQAQELGAAFSLSNAAGANFSGALTAQKDNSITLAAATLVTAGVDVVVDSRMSTVRLSFDSSRTPAFLDAPGSNPDNLGIPGKVTLRADGSVRVQPNSSFDRKVDFAAANRSAVQRANFDSFDNDGIHFDLYKIGSANQQLQLSYTGFGIWMEQFANGTLRSDTYNYTLFGLETSRNLILSRTGTASYSGVVYGNTASASGVLQDVGGTSHFDLNFGNHSFSGSLNLTVKSPGGSESPLGVWTFADTIVNGQMVQAALMPAGPVTGYGIAQQSITPHFYGPGAEEIGATFAIVRNSVQLPSGYDSIVSISGVTVAKRQ